MKSLAHRLKAQGSRHTTTDYVYPATQSETQIRILELKPPSRLKPTKLRGRLIIAEIKDHPAYEAISYAWGKPIFPETLELEKGVLHITKSLAAGLRQLRHPDRIRRIWVDAVCINQKDKTEKGHQVALMSLVYRGAFGVLVWLGEGNAKTHTAISIFRELAAYGRNSGLIENGDWLEFEEKSARIKGDPRIVNTVFSFTDELYLAFFAEQAWFDRLWIVQEVVLAKELTYYNGQDFLEEKAFREAVSFVYMFSTDLGFHRHVTPTHILHIQRNAHWTFIKTSESLFLMWELVEVNCKRAYGNDRDLVYGLLGLRDPTDIDIQVDYGARVEEIYAKMTSQYLERGKLTILDGAGKMDVHSNEAAKLSSLDSLPSWARDWRHRGLMLRTQKGEFAAASEASMTFIQKNSHPSIIGLGGTEVDVVKLLALPNSFDMPDTFDLYTKLQPFFAQHCTKSAYHTGELSSMAFARTIVADGKRTTADASLRSTSPEGLLRYWTQFEKDCRLNLHKDTQNNKAHTDLTSNSPYAAQLEMAMTWHNIIITASGYFGFVPKTTLRGDLIAIFHGAETPFVVRRVEKGSPSKVTESIPGLEGMSSHNTFELIGSCYLHGFMNNEALKPDFDDKRQTFFLI